MIFFALFHLLISWSSEIYATAFTPSETVRKIAHYTHVHTGMDGKLFNQMHFPAKSNVIRSRFSLSFSLLLCWLYSCTCSYTHKVQAENLIRRFTNTSPTIRESRGDWLWKTADTKIKKTTTVLQFMLEALWQCTTLCVLFTNGTF